MTKIKILTILLKKLNFRYKYNLSQALNYFSQQALIKTILSISYKSYQSKSSNRNYIISLLSKFLILSITIYQK